MQRGIGSILAPIGPILAPTGSSGYMLAHHGPKVLTPKSISRRPSSASLVGDAAYNMGLLNKEMIGGIDNDPYVALESQRKIREFCKSRPVVVLPSHEEWTSHSSLGRRYMYSMKITMYLTYL
ncbi:hypothetical protein F4819DRAFT_367106 [Hypoxylon fuscum]|nr:hypothetical protein F4819DRAFT_367106 [Hypoxylon fuscum]